MKLDNKIYLYDGTFINLLNLIKILIQQKIKPLNIKNEYEYQPNLLDITFKLQIEESNMIDIIIKKISYDALRRIYYVFLSNEENKELIIYYFVLNGLYNGQKTVYLRNLNCVREVLRISKYVSFENHRLKGFVRFKEYENKFLYAEISPTNNILYLLVNHFSKRLKNELWIIKDTSRNLTAIYDKKKVTILEEDFNINSLKPSDSENNFEDLWKAFFETIGIKERKNKRCQMNFMPKKYWKNMLEMEGKI